MLTDPTFGIDRRLVVVGRRLGGGMGLRVLQWVALDRARAIARGELTALVERLAPPDRSRDYVRLGLTARAGRSEGVSWGPATVLGAIARAFGLVAAGWVSVVVGRFTWWPYHAKHARRSGRLGRAGPARDGLGRAK